MMTNLVNTRRTLASLLLMVRGLMKAKLKTRARKSLAVAEGERSHRVMTRLLYKACEGG